MKRTPRDFILLGRIWAELGSGRITEAFVQGDKHEYVHGSCEGQRITINPMHATVDTLIHECLHRLFPAWTEIGVRRATTRLRARLSDEEVQALHEEYQRRAKKRRRPVRLAE